MCHTLALAAAEAETGLSRPNIDRAFIPVLLELMSDPGSRRGPDVPLQACRALNYFLQVRSRDGGVGWGGGWGGRRETRKGGRGGVEKNEPPSSSPLGGGGGMFFSLSFCFYSLRAILLSSLFVALIFCMSVIVFLLLVVRICR